MLQHYSEWESKQVALFLSSVSYHRPVQWMWETRPYMNLIYWLIRTCRLHWAQFTCWALLTFSRKVSSIYPCNKLQFFFVKKPQLSSELSNISIWHHDLGSAFCRCAGALWIRWWPADSVDRVPPPRRRLPVVAPVPPWGAIEGADVLCIAIYLAGFQWDYEKFLRW